MIGTTIRKVMFLSAGALFFSSCVSTQVARLNVAQKNEGQLEVYMTSLPNRPYEELVYLESSASIFHSKKALLKKLKRKALKENADAIVAVKFGYIPWISAGIPMVEGVAIKYKN